MDSLSANVANMNIADQQSTRKKKPARAYHQFTQNPVNGDVQYNPQSVNQPAFNTHPVHPGAATPHMHQSPTFGNGQEQQQQQQQQPFQQAAYQAPQDNATNSIDLATQRLMDQKEYLNKTFDTSRDSVLPLKTTQFYSVDTGSCDPRLMGLTMYNIPKDESARNVTKLPLGVSIQPFAPITAIGKPAAQPEAPGSEFQGEAAFGGSDENSESEKPYTNEISTATGMIRCKRCRAYNNHNFKFSHDQGSFVCNFCRVKTSVSLMQDTLGSASAAMGMQVVEPNFIQPQYSGVLDFKAPPEYNHKPGQESKPLHYVFLVDISSFANGNKSSISCIDAIQSSIEYISNNQPLCKVCIIGFDKSLHFFKLNKNLETAQEFVVSDLYGDTRNSDNEDGSVFLPFYDGMFVQPAESMHIIEDTLNKLKDFCFQTNTGYVKQEMDVCFGPAVEAAMMALSTFSDGGKILCSLNSLPKYSRGNLQLRKDDSIKKNLKFGDHTYYKKLGNKLVHHSCGLDLFITTDGFMDICNVGFPSLITGGQIKYYPHFQTSKDDFQICSDYLNSIANTIGYQGTLKLRCSAGLSVDTYYKESCDYSSQEPPLSIITTDTNVSVLLKYDSGSLNEKYGQEVFFQSALLYTDLKGQRRIRVLNTSGAIQSNLMEVYKFVDQENVANIIIKDITLTLLNNQATDYDTVRKTIDNKLCDIFTQYRAVTNNHKVNIMVLPESMKLLPTLLLAFESSRLMKQTKQSTRGNERVLQCFQFLTLPATKLFFKVYPQIIPLHCMMNQEQDLVLYDLNQKLLSIDSVEEFSVSNSVKKLIDGGCYLIFNGEIVYLWYNQNTNPLLLKDLLGFDYNEKHNTENANVPGQPQQQPYACIEIEGGLFPKVDTEINHKVSELLTYWKKLCSYHNYIKVSPLSPMNYAMNTMEFSNILAYDIFFDDRNMENVDNLETYLLNLHKNIKEKLDKNDYTTISKKEQQKDHAFQQWYQNF